jgi:prepilin-type N-terminal cleavage/methylation domain-containing protein
MWKSIIKLVRGSQRGFTLIELLAVMAVIGVLAGIVTTSVSGTSETSTVAQARSDASTVETTAGTFFGDQGATEVLTPRTLTVTAKIASTITVTGSVVTTEFDTPTATTQEKSSRWPEVFLTEDFAPGATTSACVDSGYCNELPTVNAFTNGVVIKVIVADSDGAAITRSTLLTTYTALDFATLTSKGYMVASPDSALQQAEVDVGDKTIKVHNFLWLFRKSTSAGGTGESDSRGVAVFKLSNVKVLEVAGTDDTVTLSYSQIF